MHAELVNIYHRINTILGTEIGEFLKKAVEFLIIMIINYMLVSEYRRTRTKELKYLIVAFSILAVQRMIVTILLLFDVFGLEDYNFMLHFFIMNNLFEIVALLMIAGAFLYTYKTVRWWYHNLQMSFIYIGMVYILLELLWIFIGTRSIAVFIGLHIFMDFLALGASLVPIILLRGAKKDRYADSVAVAFLMFALSYSIHLINIMFFSLNSPFLRIINHPFQLLGILLFVRVIYLKLVDKATLKEKLKATTKKYERTKQISKMKDEFISVISHELRTPLTSMNLYASLLMDEKMGDLTEKQKFAIGIIKKENKRLAELINNLLDLSKLEQGKAVLKEKEAELFPLIQHQAHMAAIHMITPVVRVPKDMKVWIDEPKFNQIVSNLVSNSVKHTPKRGKIYFIARRTKENWSLEIRDTGKGIPKSKIPKLFDKFYQVDTYLTREETGTGLGLTIVKRLVELHKGKIEVKSELGKGTRMIMTFPNE